MHMKLRVVRCPECGSTARLGMLVQDTVVTAYECFRCKHRWPADSIIAEAKAFLVSPATIAPSPEMDDAIAIIEKLIRALVESRASGKEVDGE